MTAMQFEQYREIARKALDLAAVEKSERKPIYFGVSMEELSRQHWFEQEQKLEKIRKAHQDDPIELKKQLERHTPNEKSVKERVHFWNRGDGRRIGSKWQRNSWRGKFSIPPRMDLPAVPESFTVVASLPARQTLTVDLWDVLPDTGLIRVRALATRSNPDNPSPPTLSLFFGHVVSNNSFASEKVGSDQEILSISGKPQFYEWTFPLSEVVRNPFRGLEELKGPNPAEYLRFLNTSSNKERIILHYVEVTAPFYEEWPPASHRKIFPPETDGSESVTDARKIILSFMEKAWRRPVSTEEVDQKLVIFTKLRNAKISFKNSIIEIAPHKTWKKSYPLIQLKEKSQDRISKNRYYNKLKQVSLKLKKNQKDPIQLNLNSSWQHQKWLKQTNKEIESLQKNNPNYTFVQLNQKNINKKWFKSIQKDPTIYEALHVLNDLAQIESVQTSSVH